MRSDSWISRMKEKRKQKQEMKMKQKFSFLTDIIAENEKSTKALYEFVEKSKSEIIHELLNVNKSIQVLDNNLKKLQSDIGESKLIAQENIEEFKNRLMENSGDIKETIRSVIEKVEQIDKAGLEREKQFGDMLLTKSEMITSEIEDIKSLVKLLAINELVGEIDISAT